MRRLFAYTLVCFTCFSAPVMAQDDEESGGMLVDFLQDTLSDDSRYIKVIGLDGALSARATIKQITIADDDGIWLTINDAVLDWNRLALVRGRFSVNALNAAEIIIDRAPAPVATDTPLPAPEATPFQVPELPVAIELGEISVGRLVLGKPVIGIAAELELSGALTLADGALDTKLDITRLDRVGDTVDLIAKFANETSHITLDLAVVEAAGGLISTALHIPDQPPLRLSAKGGGPVTDFTARIALATDGVDRVAGQVRLQKAAAPDEGAESGVAFSADLAGDVTPLLAPDYHDFFGTDTKLDLKGQRDGDGHLAIDTFNVASNALMLNGALDIAASGDIAKVLLQGRIAPPAGTEVVLPMTGPRTAISAAQLTARLDAATGNRWDLALTLDGLTRPDLAVRHAEIRADGTLDQGDLTQMAGNLTAALNGLAFTDTALAQAVGQDVTLKGEFALKGDGALELSQVALTGSDYTGALDGRLQGLESGFAMDGTARIGAADLSRFSGLAGRPLAGAITARLEGKGAPLGGHFDFKLDAKADNLSADIEQLDPLITGQTTLKLVATRGADGLDIHEFRLDGTALSAHASGAVRSRGSDLTFEAQLDDISRVVKELSGPVSLKGDVTQDSAGTLSGKVRVDAPDASFADLAGSMAKDGAIDLTFLAQLGDVSQFVKEVSGPVSLKGDVTRDSTGALAGKVRVDGPEASFADLAGSLATDGSIVLTYDALLAHAERFVPEIRGNLTAKGTAGRKGTLWQVDGDATGPAGIKANVAGTWDQASGLADLETVGQLQLAAANRFIAPRSVLGPANFDLALKGKPDLSAISGTIKTTGTKVALPHVGQTINDINATVSLKEGQANVTLTGALAAGGTFRVSGPITLSPPFQGTITTELQQIVLTDNISYTSSANGRLVFSGPLTGNANLSGQIVFGETEINLNAASGSASAAPIPEIAHTGESSSQRSTRSKAGLIKTSSASSGPVIGLDITLSAPNKVFARGRGLQAELGGTIVVRGTSQQVAPAGQIELIRGNMDLLGRRLKLTKGLVSLQGKLEPYVEFAATTTTSEGSATLEISGPLSSPEIKVFSDPERPSEEALAMLIFGNRFAEMSPIAIAQMAASVAQLSGKGGGGVTDKARKGLGVDTLDVGTDEDGNASVGAGVYVLDNVYTDFSVNTNGDTELNLNLDVSDNFTLKGTVDNAGDTSMGMFFERDY